MKAIDLYSAHDSNVIIVMSKKRKHCDTELENKYHEHQLTAALPKMIYQDIRSIVLQYTVFPTFFEFVTGKYMEARLCPRHKSGRLVLYTEPMHDHPEKLISVITWKNAKAQTRWGDTIWIEFVITDGQEMIKVFRAYVMSIRIFQTFSSVSDFLTWFRTTEDIIVKCLCKCAQKDREAHAQDVEQALSFAQFQQQ